MAAADEAPVANGAPTTERNDAKPSGDNQNKKPDNGRGNKGKKGDRGRGEWRWVYTSFCCWFTIGGLAAFTNGADQTVAAQR